MPVDANPTTVTICTPTFNRRPFIPHLRAAIAAQTYPAHLIQWVVIDDGTDPIGDLLPDTAHYVRIDSGKLSLGEKRNIAHLCANGDIIVYMDDDDYYPPTRVQHAVDVLQRAPDDVAFAATGRMHMWFSDLQKMYVYDSANANRATAATFAFRREFCDTHSYEPTAVLAEKGAFLRNWTTPIAPLDTMQTILVFAHAHNSADKMQMIENRNPYLTEVALTPADFIADAAELAWYTTGVSDELATYSAGTLNHKPDVKAAIGAATAKMAAQQTAQTEMTAKYEATIPSAQRAGTARFSSMDEMEAHYKALLAKKTIIIADLLGRLKAQKNEP